MTFGQLLLMITLSGLPIVEMRYSLPLALLEGEAPGHLGFLVPSTLLDENIAWYYALPACCIGNLLPVPFLLWFLDPLTRLFSRIVIFKKLIDWVFKRTRRQGRIVEKYQRIGLILVVAIPLPGTGVYTGSILAHLLGIKFRKSFISIAIGVFIAGVIITTLSLLGWAGAIIAGVALLSLAVFSIWRS